MSSQGGVRMNDFMVHGSTQGNMQNGSVASDNLAFFIWMAVVFLCPPLMVFAFLYCLFDDIF